MGMNKNFTFDKDYCRILDMCMNRGGYGSITFFVDMQMSDFTMKSCVNSEAVTTSVIANDYFDQFEFQDLTDIEFMDEDDCDDE